MLHSSVSDIFAAGSTGHPKWDLRMLKFAVDHQIAIRLQFELVSMQYRK